MRIALIDNYDSFTYNLAHLVRELGATVDVMRNDRFPLDALRSYDKIILSPGPGIPEEAGLLLDVIRTYSGQKPILGICLGHQAIGQAFGAALSNLSEVYHGVATPCQVTVQDEYIFQGMGSEIEVGRYHSWVVSNTDLPACLEVTSLSPEGQIMSLRHREHDTRGIQFHPESILTTQGRQILANWLAH